MNTYTKVKKHLLRLKLPAYIIVAFVIGFLLRDGAHEPQSPHTPFTITSETTTREWTCSMHPQIRQPDPGQCPICGMDLIPVSSESQGKSGSPQEITLSARAMKLASVQLAPVERKYVTKEIRLVGKIAFDESRINAITAWIPGRLDRLFVDYTGIQVRKGDHLADIYSPELFSTQEELLQALKTARSLDKSSLSTTKELSELTVDSARDKLRLLGMTPEQIEAFEQQGAPAEHVTLYSTTEGTVIEKHAVEGAYVSTGSKIYTIADLSSVWVMLDVYESDLEWIRYGQEVSFSTEAYPGENFTGKIAFIDPSLNDKTRTVRVRVNTPNQGRKLKSDMFVRALVSSQIAEGGKVMDISLAGKYISPMHPEIVKDKPGFCDICGMPLVKAESLGYAAAGKDEPPLVIPASAPLITGKRAVVYTALSNDEGTYTGREVVLGPRAGDYYQVREGVEEGEMVVVNGNFKIDSAVQLLAGQSMMNPEGQAVPAHSHGNDHNTTLQLAQSTTKHDGSGAHTADTGAKAADMDMKADGSEMKLTAFDVPQTFKAQLDSVYAAYYRVQYALSHDSVEGAVKESGVLLKALKKVDMKLVTGKAHMAWMDELNIINQNTEKITKAKNLADARTGFKPVSDALIRVTRQFGTRGGQGVYLFHCPMAFDNKGADWLQGKADIENPFYGSMMFTCGSLTEKITEKP